MALPIPLAAPVMMADLPWSFMMVPLLLGKIVVDNSALTAQVEDSDAFGEIGYAVPIRIRDRPPDVVVAALSTGANPGGSAPRGHGEVAHRRGRPVCD